MQIHNNIPEISEKWQFRYVQKNFLFPQPSTKFSDITNFTTAKLHIKH